MLTLPDPDNYLILPPLSSLILHIGVTHHLLPSAALIGRLRPGVIQSHVGVGGHVTSLLHVLVLRCGSDVIIPLNHRRYHRVIARIKRSSVTQAKLSVMTSADYGVSRLWRQQIMTSANYDVSKSWCQQITTSARYDVSKSWCQQIMTSANYDVTQKKIKEGMSSQWLHNAIVC